MANRLSPEDAFKDFEGRRAGILKALNTDVDKFFQECDPAKDNLCLYGHPDETWQVNFPSAEVPDELPEPTIGINFARDGMKKCDWLKMVAVHSDSWILSVAFFYAGQSKFDKESRAELFDMINDLPTMYEIMSGDATDNKNQVKERTSVGSRMANKSAPKPVKAAKVSRGRPQKRKKEEDIESIDRLEEGEEEEGEEEEKASCGGCGKNSGSGKFWIFCDDCKCWFHGKCVGMTPALAEGFKKYTCPSCSYKRTRGWV